MVVSFAKGFAEGTLWYKDSVTCILFTAKVVYRSKPRNQQGFFKKTISTPVSSHLYIQACILRGVYTATHTSLFLHVYRDR